MGKSAKLNHPNLPPKRNFLGSAVPPIRKKVGGQALNWVTQPFAV
jgi:hypothetical protein